MAKTKKPAPKGGKKIAAPKKAAKAAPKKGRASNEPTPIEETNPPMPPLADAQQGRAWADLTERQADQLIADKMRADAFASTQPVRQTVEEQFDSDAALMQALHDPENQPSQHGTVPMSYLDNQKPSLLRRAWDRVKRAFRYRSAKTGEYVTKQYAEANPDTTVRERAD